MFFCGNWQRNSRWTVWAIFCSFAVGPAFAENLPDIRPALVGSGPKALVNLIDAQGLMKKGQDHGAIFFRCLVEPNGQTDYRATFGGTPGSEKLKEEVQHKLYTARFIPPVYNHHRTYAWFYGTVVYSVNDGKPRLRVFANQEKSELAQESDFIAPQSIYIPNHYYEPTKYPGASWQSDEFPATVELLITVDVSGKLKDARVIQENPPNKKFGENVLKEMQAFTFLPSFRHGLPTEATTHLTYTFIPGGWSWR